MIIVARLRPFGPNQSPAILVVVLRTKGVPTPMKTHPIVGVPICASQSPQTVMKIEKVIAGLIPNISIAYALGRYRITTVKR